MKLLWDIIYTTSFTLFVIIYVATYASSGHFFDFKNISGLLIILYIAYKNDRQKKAQSVEASTAKSDIPSPEKEKKDMPGNQPERPLTE